MNKKRIMKKSGYIASLYTASFPFSSSRFLEIKSEGLDPAYYEIDESLSHRQIKAYAKHLIKCDVAFLKALQIEVEE